MVTKPSHAGASSRDATNRPRPHFLICDDEPRICEMVSRALADVAECDVALNGADALSLLNAHRYDLLLLDLKMPKLDGFAVLQTLREARRPLRVIVLTAHQELDVAHGAHRMYSLLGYITKPYEIHELHVAIERAMAQAPQPV